MKFDKEKYKVNTWKNWMILHWILNPVLAINELILGQRIPKISLENKKIDKPRMEKTIVPCPYCKTLHDGRIWSTENGTAFKNWFGLYCPDCGKIIPCLTNALSFIILVITYPIWGWFRKFLKEKCLAKQPERYKNINREYTPYPFDNKSWIWAGLSWGLFMFVLMSIVYPYYDNQTINWKTLLVGIIIWTISGLGYSYTMKLFTNKIFRPKREATDN